MPIAAVVARRCDAAFGPTRPFSRRASAGGPSSGGLPHELRLESKPRPSPPPLACRTLAFRVHGRPPIRVVAGVSHRAAARPRAPVDTARPPGCARRPCLSRDIYQLNTTTPTTTTGSCGRDGSGPCEPRSTGDAAATGGRRRPSGSTHSSLHGRASRRPLPRTTLRPPGEGPAVALDRRLGPATRGDGLQPPGPFEDRVRAVSPARTHGRRGFRGIQVNGSR